MKKKNDQQTIVQHLQNLASTLKHSIIMSPPSTRMFLCISKTNKQTATLISLKFKDNIRYLDATGCIFFKYSSGCGANDRMRRKIQCVYERPTKSFMMTKSFNLEK